MTVSLLPQPRYIRTTGGLLALPPTPRVAATGGDVASDCAELLAGYLEGTTVEAGEPADIVLELLPDAAPDAPSSPEAYTLSIDAGGVRVAAARAAGLRWGVQTLRQLALDGPVLPHVEVEDWPVHPWRQVLLDPARHFITIAELEQFIDVMALHRFNVLHLHLTDDQGWRFEVPSRPLLTQVGAWRRSSQRPPARTDDGIRHGGSYSQAELRDLVVYAERRGVTIVPEIDLPGHMRAAIAAYPELGNTDVSGPHEVGTRWGVEDAVLNLEEATVAFVEEVLAEVVEVFPAPWVHIGGDECPTTEWEASPRAAERMRELGIASASGAQDWWMARAVEFLRSRGRTPIVWDEAATDALPHDVVTMAWRSHDAGLAALRSGHDVVMTPLTATYLDYRPTEEPDDENGMEPFLTLLDAHAYDPARGAEGLPGRVLGTGAMLWGEYLPTMARTYHQAFPRLLALAEVAWGTADSELGEFHDRLETQAARLAAMGVPVTHAGG